MAGGKVGLAHVLDVGAWASASPRVQRALAALVGVCLAVSVTTIAGHHPDSLAEAVPVAAAVGPVDAAVVVAPEVPVVREARVEVARSKPAPRLAPEPDLRRSDWAVLAARIRGCESHGHPGAPPDYKAKNPNSSASGAYQIVDATWAGRYGVDHASDATPTQQEQAAADLYRRHGTADWAASASCWR